MRAGLEMGILIDEKIILGDDDILSLVEYAELFYAIEKKVNERRNKKQD